MQGMESMEGTDRHAHLEAWSRRGAPRAQAAPMTSMARLASVRAAVRRAMARARVAPRWPGRVRAVLSALCLAVLVPAAHAALPARDLVVELRQVDEGGAGAGTYSAGAAQTEPLAPPVQVQVANGQRAELQWHDAVPMQWLQSASVQQSSQSSTASAGAATGTGSGTGTGAGTGAAPGPAAHSQQASQGAAITQSLQWFDAGQGLNVRPRWGGGQQNVQVDIEWQQAARKQDAAAALPSQSRSSLKTRVTLVLGRWTTIAASGAAQDAEPGSYSSASASAQRRLLQLRVTAP